MGYFEIINASAPHIYHSALAFSPQESIVRKLYESHAHPLTRVVHGLPISWDENTTAAVRPHGIEVVAWSPCDGFIAITCENRTGIEILDSVTLQRLQTLEFPGAQHIPTTNEALIFSPDSRILTFLGKNALKRKLLVISWDLQTAGVASVINLKWQGSPEMIYGAPCITSLANGNMVGVRAWHPNGNRISIFDVASGVYINSHSPTNVIAHTNGIWAHGESLWFTTLGRTTITIWEVGFTSDAVPTKVKTLPFPGERFRSNFKQEPQEQVQFLPALCRLALVSEGEVVVWDAQNSKSLLYCTDATFYPRMSFSPDGRFFACSTTGTDVCLWKESPTGYTLHQTLTSSTTRSRPLLSTNGESIVVFGGSAIRLWHTKDSTTPLPVLQPKPNAPEISSWIFLLMGCRQWSRGSRVARLRFSTSSPVFRS